MGFPSLLSVLMPAPPFIDLWNALVTIMGRTQHCFWPHNPFYCRGSKVMGTWPWNSLTQGLPNPCAFWPRDSWPNTRLNYVKLLIFNCFWFIHAASSLIWPNISVEWPIDSYMASTVRKHPETQVLSYWIQYMLWIKDQKWCCFFNS
jgi:hypothetical protein